MSNNDERDNEGGEARHDERPETFREEPAYILRSASEPSDVNQLVLDAVLDSMHANLYVTDPQTDKILFMNRAMKEEYGLRAPKAASAGACCRTAWPSGVPSAPSTSSAKAASSPWSCSGRKTAR